MAIPGWNLLMEAVSIAGRLNQLEEYIQGGLLTDVLNQLGEVLGESGSDHVRQAAYSSDPRARIGHAAGDFQTAYFAYVRASERGPSRSLRTLFKPSDLRGTYAKAGGCAAWVALLQAYLGESPTNIREWLDRAGQQMTADWRALHARKKMRETPFFGEFVVGEADIWYADWIDLIGRYSVLESRLLPQEYVRGSEANFQRILPSSGG